MHDFLIKFFLILVAYPQGILCSALSNLCEHLKKKKFVGFFYYLFFLIAIRGKGFPS